MKRWSKESWNDDHDVFTGYPQMQYLIMIFTMIILCIGDVIYTRIDDQEPIYLSFWRPYWWDITHLIKIHSSRSYLEVNPSLCLFTGSMIMRVWFIIATWAISLFRLLYRQFLLNPPFCLHSTVNQRRKLMLPRDFKAWSYFRLMDLILFACLHRTLLNFSMIMLSDLFINTEAWS